jgi:hypothetical protein
LEPPIAESANWKLSLAESSEAEGKPPLPTAMRPETLQSMDLGVPWHRFGQSIDKSVISIDSAE